MQSHTYAAFEVSATVVAVLVLSTIIAIVGLVVLL